MDIVQQGYSKDSPYTPPYEPPSKAENPYRHGSYTTGTQETIDLIENLKQKGEALPPLDFGPEWEQVDTQTYIDDITDLLSMEGLLTGSGESGSVLRNRLFQKQAKTNIEKSTIYRRGNITLIVPPEYRNTPEKMKKLVQLIENLQSKHGINEKIEVNLHTWSPGIIDKGGSAVLPAWRSGGWASRSGGGSNDSMLISLGAEGMLVDEKVREPEVDEDGAKGLMSAAYQLEYFLYALIHEWGHLRDYLSAGDSADHFSGITARLDAFFKDHPEIMKQFVSQYGKGSIKEATAELFAQMFAQENFDVDKVDIPQEILDIIKS